MAHNSCDKGQLLSNNRILHCVNWRKRHEHLTNSIPELSLTHNSAKEYSLHIDNPSLSIKTTSAHILLWHAIDDTYLPIFHQLMKSH